MRIHVVPTSKVVEATGARDTYALLGLLLTRADRITFATMQGRGSANAPDYALRACSALKLWEQAKGEELA
jgi:hypothetical protein